MTLEQLINSLDLSHHFKPIAEATIMAARLYFLSDSQSTKYEDDHYRSLQRFLKVFSALEPTSEDFYKVRDFIINDLPQFKQTEFPNTRG